MGKPPPPHYLGSDKCDCLGCRTFHGAKTIDHPLPRVASTTVDAEAVQRSDEAVNEMYSTSYLAPLLPMTRSQNWEIRRGSITSVARLSDDHLRAAAASLRNLQGRSVLRDLLSFSLSEMCTMPQRREAVLGLVNLIGHRFTHHELVSERLLPEVLRLLNTCEQESSMTIVLPEVSGAVETLCRNDEMLPALLASGFAAALLHLAVSHEDEGDGLLVLGLRRSAVQALVSLSRAPEAKLEIKRQGGLGLATGLLRPHTSDPDLRKGGAVLACNLCLHAHNKADVVASELFPQMLAAVQASRSRTPIVAGEDSELALALASLCNAPELHEQLVAAPATPAALLALLTNGSRDACRHAAWATSNLATHRPVAVALLADPFLDALVALARKCDDKPTRNDAMRALCWLAMDATETLPRGAPSRRALLAVVVEGATAPEATLLELALVCIGLWSESLSLHAELVYAGALPPLVLALRQPNAPSGNATKAHLLAVRALANIAVHKTYRQHLVAENTLPALLQLVRSKHPGVRLCAVRIVCSLSRDVDGALAILRADGLGTLQSMARGMLEPGSSAAYTPVRSLRVDESAVRLPGTIQKKVQPPAVFSMQVASLDPKMKLARVGIGKLQNPPPGGGGGAGGAGAGAGAASKSRGGAAGAGGGGGMKAGGEDPGGSAEEELERDLRAITRIQSRVRGGQGRRRCATLRSPTKAAGWFTHWADRDDARIPRALLEREYAQTAADNCHRAWALESEVGTEQEWLRDAVEGGTEQDSRPLAARVAQQQQLEEEGAGLHAAELQQSSCEECEPEDAAAAPAGAPPGPRPPAPVVIARAATAPLAQTTSPTRSLSSPSSTRRLDVKAAQARLQAEAPSLSVMEDDAPAGGPPASPPRSPTSSPIKSLQPSMSKSSSSLAVGGRDALAKKPYKPKLAIRQLLGSTVFRVHNKDLVLLSAIIVGWRYLLSESKKARAAQRRTSRGKAPEEVVDQAARVLQNANRKHQRKRQSKGATRIQASFRGKKAREETREKEHIREAAKNRAASSRRRREARLQEARGRVMRGLVATGTF